jgi:ABC-type dipeptide/oligopeptide/nickel transport system ATPase subunit
MRLVDVTGLHVKYGTFEAVKGVSFHLDKGEIVGIIGQSGSGKSTIAKTLAGIERKNQGNVVIAAKSIQMVFQDAVGSLNPRMTVRATLKEVIRHGKGVKRTDESLEDRIVKLLSHVGLSKAVLDQYPREMSGGQCQRVSIARALAFDPDVIVADEPVSALDVSVQAKVLNLLRDLRDECSLSILLIAHDLAVVKNICDRVYVMEKGVFVDEGKSEDVFSSPASDYTKKLLEAVPDVSRAVNARIRDGL